MNVKKPALILTAILCCGALLAACSSDDSSSDSVNVSDVWTRITAPTATMGAVYMKLESADGDKLMSASVPTDIAGKTEVHETVTGDEGESMEGESMNGDSMDGEHTDSGDMDGETMDSGDMDGEHMDGKEGDAMMGMRPIESLELPAGEEVSLEPGGYHIMLFELKAPIADGDTIPVTLTFEKAGEVTVDAEARDAEN
jgi:copper(I)-binding protein